MALVYLYYLAMTSLNIATDIPSQINTLEKLAAWVGLALARCNPTVQILEDPNAAAQRTAQIVLIKADDGSNRLIVRVSLPVVDDHASNGFKWWQNPTEISTTALPTAFKAN